MLVGQQRGETDAEVVVSEADRIDSTARVRNTDCARRLGGQNLANSQVSQEEGTQVIDSNLALKFLRHDRVVNCLERGVFSPVRRCEEPWSISVGRLPPYGPRQETRALGLVHEP